MPSPGKDISAKILRKVDEPEPASSSISTSNSQLGTLNMSTEKWFGGGGKKKCEDMGGDKEKHEMIDKCVEENQL